MNSIIQIKEKKKRIKNPVLVTYLYPYLARGLSSPERVKSLSSSSFYQIKYKNKKTRFPVWQEKRTSFCFGSFLSFFGWPTRFPTFPFWNRWIDIPPSPYFFQLVWDWRPRFGFFSPLHSDGWIAMSKNGRDFFFPLFFVSCCNRPANSTGFLVITNFQTSSRRAKNLKGRRMRAVRVVCAQQRKNKKRKTFSLHTPLTLRQERPANLAMKMFYFVHFSSGFLFHL